MVAAVPEEEALAEDCCSVVVLYVLAGICAFGPDRVSKRVFAKVIPSAEIPKEVALAGDEVMAKILFILKVEDENKVLAMALIRSRWAPNVDILLSGLSE